MVDIVGARGVEHQALVGFVHRFGMSEIKHRLAGRTQSATW